MRSVRRSQPARLRRSRSALDGSSSGRSTASRAPSRSPSWNRWGGGANLWRLRRRFLLLVAVFAVASPAVASPFVRGIDVSRWKGSIAWTRVAHGGYRFAFAEATNGFTADRTFIRNRSGAKAARIAFGGFHFARPAGSTRSAVIANPVGPAGFFFSVPQPQ